MSTHDVLVIGGGISGAGFAYHAARAGRSVLVCERDAAVGGSLASVREPDGYWYELGAHTCYNSYGALLELLEGAGLLDDLLARGKSVLRFMEGDRVLPGKNLGLLLSRFHKLELLRAVPRWFGADASGKTVREHYGSLVGARNYERVLGPMLAAVPSQSPDEFPADMLFKKRARRKDVMCSYTLPGGLATAVEALLATDGVEVRTGCAVAALERQGERFAVTLQGGERIDVATVALAVPPSAAATLLASALPEVAAKIARFREVRIDSLGFAVRRDRVALPYATFLIPLGDVFHSIVTRDVVPDETWRGFAMHFRPGLTREQRLERATAVLGVERSDLHGVCERTGVLPAPTLGHADRVAAIDRGLAGVPLALCGNWFGGLSIEDCALRARSEWARVG